MRSTVKDAAALPSKKQHDRKEPRQGSLAFKMRAPYERVFSKRSKQVRYRGQAKVQFQVACNAIGHNLKRLVVLGVDKIPIVMA